MIQISEKDIGNTLMHAICMNDMDVDSVKAIQNNDREKAISQIKNYKIKAIRHMGFVLAVK